ncbi:MAG: Uncharacterized protein FD157_893 [Rhodocyclaceae bacterium]|nr:MAG: Uncharacterized protein FD157_893 [Rhodocyclaceae bacterium]TND05146.1 MAG: Uncharacterized protein FD118_550 [Rhodocyclaceae bacterium]
MAIFFYEEFLTDLRTEGDSKFARRVLSKILDSTCKFPSSTTDHRYHGIDDAWIRYVSMGGAAIRVIYIQKGADIFLYRAGPHSVEDHLSPPLLGATLIPIIPFSAGSSVTSSASSPASRAAVLDGQLLQNYQPTYIRMALLSRRFIKHDAITLISPYLSEELFSIFSPFGKVLHDLKEEGTKLTLITRPPQSLEGLAFFSMLEKDGISILFHSRVHAKLYLFEETADNVRPAKRVALIGSANLTVMGLAIGADSNEVKMPNEELAYELPEHQFEHALDFACYLSLAATDIPKERVRLIRRK